MKAELKKVSQLLGQMARYARQQGSTERLAFDPCSVLTLYEILDATASWQPDGSYTASSYALAEQVNSTRKIIRVRLKELARFGVVRVFSSWRNDKTNRRKPQSIFVNPQVIFVLQPGTKPAQRLAVVKYLVGLGLRRLQESDEDLQGFKFDCLYGHAEESQTDSAELNPATNVTGYAPPDVGDQVDALIASADANKEAKARDRQKWLKHDAAFIAGCAELWVYAQVTMGFGQARPNWEGEPQQLAPGAKRERRELTQTIQQYGCRTAALAWYVFVGGQAELDSNGRPTFSIVSPHRQYASMDKKPSTYVKHFNAILKDPIFKSFAVKQWDQTEQALRSYFGDVFDVKPRYEDEYSQTGIAYGSNMPSIEDVTNGQI